MIVSPLSGDRVRDENVLESAWSGGMPCSALDAGFHPDAKLGAEPVDAIGAVVVGIGDPKRTESARRYADLLIRLDLPMRLEVYGFLCLVHRHATLVAPRIADGDRKPIADWRIKTEQRLAARSHPNPAAVSIDEDRRRLTVLRHHALALPGSHSHGGGRLAVFLAEAA